MKNDSKRVRTEQIAAIALMRTLAGIRLEQTFGSLFDMLATFPSYGLRFGINIVSSSYSDTVSYKKYLEYLSSVDYSERDNRLPIVIVSVNESSETAMIGIQVGWRFGQPVVFKKPAMMNLTEVNANKILDAIKTMDETIRILSEHGMKVIKTISIRMSNPNGMIHHAKIVYMRDFTEEYKMKPKEVVDERKKFNRLLNGVPEDEYPNDFLDNSILSMVQQQFPDAQMRSSLMLFSSDLRDIQRLSQSVRLDAEMFIEPNLTDMPEIALQLFNGIEIIHFVLDVFVDVPFSRGIFENIAFQTTASINGWLNTYNEYTKVLTTLHSPTEFFIQQ